MSQNVVSLSVPELLAVGAVLFLIILMALILFAGDPRDWKK